MSADDFLADLAEQLRDQHVPGGCDDCDAWQTLTGSSGVYVLGVHHDDTCPTYLAMRRRGAA
jgi:hypothetical protein